jgi:hypothetical protein
MSNGSRAQPHPSSGATENVSMTALTLETCFADNLQLELVNLYLRK